jgi:hypothetical protein
MAFGDLAQRREHLKRSLGRETLAVSGRHGLLDHDLF